MALAVIDIKTRELKRVICHHRVTKWNIKLWNSPSRDIYIRVWTSALNVMFTNLIKFFFLVNMSCLKLLYIAHHYKVIYDFLLEFSDNFFMISLEHTVHRDNSSFSFRRSLIVKVMFSLKLKAFNISSSCWIKRKI